MPAQLKPMLAQPARHPPQGPGWQAEIKWDGARAIAYIQGGRLRLESRLGNAMDERFPELAGLAAAAPVERLVLDGEIVSFDAEGRPRFGLLQKRLQRVGHFDPFDDPEEAAAAGSTGPDAPRFDPSRYPEASYMIFDLLFIDEQSTIALPYLERRRILEELDLSGPFWRTPPRLSGDIAGLLRASRQRGLEGLVAKREAGPYLPGRRSRDWLKLKNVHRREFVIGGWHPGGGRRSGQLGSLLVGGWVEPDPEAGGSRFLHYGGRVGTGFDQEWLEILGERLEPLKRGASPFRPPANRALAPPRESVYVDPVLVAEIEFGEITADGMLRHSVFKGLREDRPADEVLWQAEN